MESNVDTKHAVECTFAADFVSCAAASVSANLTRQSLTEIELTRPVAGLIPELAYGELMSHCDPAEKEQSGACSS